jgi:hypothetical protein
MTDSTTDYTRAREDIERDFPEAWIPKEAGETLIGQFVRLEDGQSAYGPRKIVVLELQDGSERAFWLHHTAAKSQFARARPQPEQVVAIRYLGKRTSRDGKSVYEDYKVKAYDSETEQVAPDWDALALEAHVEADAGAETEDLAADTRGLEHLPAEKTREAGQGKSDIPF